MKNTLVFLLRAPTHHSFTFIFDSVLFLLKFIFLLSEKYGLFDFKGASTKNWIR